MAIAALTRWIRPAASRRSWWQTGRALTCRYDRRGQYTGEAVDDCRYAVFWRTSSYRSGRGYDRAPVSQGFSHTCPAMVEVPG